MYFHNYIAVLVFLTRCLSSQCQIDQPQLANVVLTQANTMANAFVHEDFSLFAHYMNPVIVKSMGGEAKAVDVLRKMESDMKAQSLTVSKITVGEVSPIVRSGSQLQCTLVQHIEIRMSTGRAISTSTLITLSDDNGKHWTFMDTSNKDVATIKKLLPNLSSAIVIPPQQPPVQYDH